MANWIHDIEIKNFKSIRHAKIEDCRRINVFIGYPNTGKSNILEALSVIQVTKFGAKNLHDFFRFEDAAELFFQANTREASIISLNRAQSIFTQYVVNGGVSFRAAEYLPDATFLPINAPDTIMELVDVYRYTFSIGRNINEAVTYKHLQSPFGENLFLMLREHHQLRKAVNDVLGDYGLRLLIDKTKNELRLLKSIDEDSIFQLPYTLLADTIQRLIFFQTAVNTNKEAVLLFEEPEAHMFPPYIGRFMSDMMYDGNNNQFFIATHSPFILNDLMEDLEAKELSIYAVGYKNDTGETAIRRLADEEITEIYQYGIDLFFNLESFLKDAV